MIRVTVEIVPHGFEARKRTIGILEIANDGTGNSEIGNYYGTLKAEYGTRHGKLYGFKRKQQSVWTLIGGFLKLWGHSKHSPKLLEKTDVDQFAETRQNAIVALLDALNESEKSTPPGVQEQSGTDTE